MLTKEESDYILQLFKDRMYLGYRKGKYQFDYLSTSSLDKALKELGAPKAFTEDAPDTLILKYAKSQGAVKGAIHKLLVSYNKEEEAVYEPDPTLTEGVVDYLRTLDVYVTLKDDKAVVVKPPTEDDNSYRFVEDVAPSAVAKAKGIELAALINTPESLVDIEFNPLRVENLYKTSKNGVELTTLNTYCPPEWQRVDVAPSFSGIIAKIMCHLFPDEHDREYVLDWLHYALVSRNNTVLCVIGARGTGKSTIFSVVLEQLAGSHYFRLGSQSMLDDKFNSEMAGSRIVTLEEVTISESHQLNRIKSFLNDKIAIEKKGADSYTASNFASIVILSNSRDAFKIEPQERRFSLPSNTDEELTNVLHRDEIADFLERIKDPRSTEIAEFGHFLMKRVPTHSNSTPLKGKQFYTICRYNMPEWKTAILQYIMAEGQVGNTISIGTIRKAFKKEYGEEANFPYKRGVIDNFLADYKHEGVYRIGTSISSRDSRGRMTFGILPDPAFLKKFKGTTLDSASVDVEDDSDSAEDLL